jgi:hypothetical protein
MYVRSGNFWQQKIIISKKLHNMLLLMHQGSVLRSIKYALMSKLQCDKLSNVAKLSLFSSKKEQFGDHDKKWPLNHLESGSLGTKDTKGIGICT